MRAIWVVLASLLFFPAISLGQALADHVPDDAILYIGWNGGDAASGQIAGTHLKAVLDASQVSDLLSQSIPALIAKVAAQNPDVAKAMQTAVDLSTATWRHPMALYVGGMAPNAGPMPKVAMLCEAGANAAALQMKIAGLIAQSPAAPFVHCTISGQILVVATFDFTDPGSASLARDSAFTAAMSQLNAKPVAAAYLDCVKLTALAAQLMPPKGLDGQPISLPAVLAASGFDKFKSVAWTDGPDGKNWSEQSLVTPTKPGAFSEQTLPDDLLKLIPPTATVAGATTIDLRALYDALHNVAAKINPQAGPQIDQGLAAINLMAGVNIQNDVLGGFSPNWEYYIDPQSTGDGMSGMVLLNRPPDPAKLAAGLDAVERFANAMAHQQLSQTPITMEIRQTTIGGTAVHYLSTPLVSPAWAIKDGTWYGGLYPQSVAAAMSHPADKSILDNPAYQQVRKMLGGPGKIIQFSFVDLPKRVPLGYGTMLEMSRLYLGIGDLFGLSSPPMVLPPMDQILAETEPGGSISWIDDAGIHSKSIQPFPGSSAMTTLISPLGIMAAEQIGQMGIILNHI